MSLKIMTALRLYILFILALLMSGCASVYKQSLSDDAASITVRSPRVVVGEKYRPFLAININGKRVTRTKADFERDPETSFVKALIDPGSQEIKVEVTAYNNSRAKYNYKSFILKLLPKTNYELSANVPEVVSESINADSWANLKLIDLGTGKELVNEKIILKDNGFRSVAEDPTIVVPLIL
jgi:hypothetical protein